MERNTSRLRWRLAAESISSVWERRVLLKCPPLSTRSMRVSQFEQSSQDWRGEMQVTPRCQCARNRPLLYQKQTARRVVGRQRRGACWKSLKYYTPMIIAVLINRGHFRFRGRDSFVSDLYSLILSFNHLSLLHPGFLAIHQVFHHLLKIPTWR